jgi:hypothetical protein
MAAYLIDNPPASKQYRAPRRATPSGVVVVHTAENTPDFVAFDGGAEAVARFIQGRSGPGSYHDLADSDSCIQLVPYDAEAFHDATGSNPHSYGVSGATRADVWPLAPQDWINGCVHQMAGGAARYAGWLKARNGIVIPARRISRSESELRMPGFISHGERDPGRRHDPGAHFPWDQFLTEFARLTGGGTPPVAPAARTLTEVGMFILDGPGGSALVGTGYFKVLDHAGRQRWAKVPGMGSVSTTSKSEWDHYRADALYGTTADDNVA